MANFWWDYFRLWAYSLGTPDPLSKKDQDKQLTGAGVSQPDAIPDIRQDGSFWGGSRGMIRLRDSNDFVDLSSVTNRQSRYKEYERLRNVAEIETAMTVFADESCVAGSTIVSTLFYGPKTIEWLAENKPNEEFLVYCWDFNKNDYALGWAHHPRLVKTEKTVKVLLDDGTFFISTLDHRVLLFSGKWAYAGQLAFGDELTPFYRVNANQNLTKLKHNQFPRIYTNEGWKHERQFIDEWKSGEEIEKYQKVNKVVRLLAGGLGVHRTAKEMDRQWKTVEEWMHNAGFTYKEIKQLAKKEDRRKIIGILPWDEMPVYDLSVQMHENFCGESVVFHNCQTNDEAHVLKVSVKNKEVKEELEFLLFHLKMINIDRKLWNWSKNLYVFGDLFLELITSMESPKDGVLKTAMLPPESVYRIETTKGRLIEFQQSKEGVDQDSLTKAPITQATEEELRQSTAIRFHPEQVIHIRIGDDRKTFYPYGVSLMEAARGPAHQLRLMEDAMVVYRLCIRSYDKVMTRKCWKYMKDITNDDVIYTYNQATGKLEEGLVAWHGLVGKKKTYKVCSKHTSITGTSIHPVLIFDPETQETKYVRIKDLISGRHHFLRPTLSNFEAKKIIRYYKPLQVVLSKEQKDIYKKTNYASKKLLIEESLNECNYEINKKNIQKCWTFLVASDFRGLPYDLGLNICEKFGLGKPIKKNKGEKNPERIKLPTYINENFAMLFGFMLGDGCINWNKGSAKMLFSAGEYENLNSKYQNLLIKFFGKCKFQQDKRIDEGLGTYCVNSSIACEIFENLGFLGNAHTKRIPSWVFNERPEIRKAIIKGIADAEGEKRGMAMNNWNTTIRLCNKELIEDIKQVWESINFHCSKVKKIDEPERWIRDCYVPAGVSWEIYLSETVVPFHDKIISVGYADTEDVYDLTVEHPTEHNFICNGVPVSNTRAPERRVFYIDVGTLPPFKAEAFIDRMKDQFRKKKVASGKGGPAGASQVEERWHAPAQDEDYWIPIRQNSQTRIETLPGASNLGEIDDAVYFRNKLFTAMNFPKNYFSNEDPQATRITLSAQDVKFARQIERLQSAVEDGIWEMCDRHLRLRGFPEEVYDDLKIKLTPPSDWRELSKAEVTTNRITNANNLKGSQLLSDIDIYTDWLKFPEEEAKEKLGRLKIQKLEDLKLQVLAQNPILLGVASPGQGEQEIGSSSGGPNPMLSPGGGPPPAGPAGGGPGGPPAFASDEGPPETPGQNAATALAEPTEDDINKYDLDIEDYSKEMDIEEPVYS